MKSYFFNAEPTTDLLNHPTGYDREYDADDHAAFFAPFLEEAGVLGGKDPDACKIYVKSGTTLGIKPGAVYVGGRAAIFDGTETVTAFNGCKIVARMNKSADVRAFQFLAVSTLIQTEDIFDLELAGASVSDGAATVSDARTFLISAVRPPNSSIPAAPLKSGNPAVSDTFAITDSADGNKLKRLSFGIVKSTLLYNPAIVGAISSGRKPGTVVGSTSLAVGSNAEASGVLSQAMGRGTTASGECSHAEGSDTSALSFGAHAEGLSTRAEGLGAHAEGQNTVANGTCAHAEGKDTQALADYSHAGGSGTIANLLQYAIGRYNISADGSWGTGTRFIIGGGIGDGERKNAFRVEASGSAFGGQYNSSGADYAELFEWLDGNPGKEDRAGRFVTLEGDRLRLAAPGDAFILGIVSAAPSVVGDVYDDQWRGMYVTDVFGRVVTEMRDFPAETALDGTVIREARRELAPKLNPDYDSTRPYMPRTKRPEWDAVGMMGKLVAVDDGTCEVDGYCTVGKDGTATKSDKPTRYRVMARLDETHVRVLIC